MLSLLETFDMTLSLGCGPFRLEWPRLMPPQCSRPRFSTVMDITFEKPPAS